MRTVMVRYRVKPDRVAENEKLIREVYEELHRDGREGLRYATFKLEDGVSFMHVAEVSDPDTNPLGTVAAFARFQEDIAERCEEPPRVTTLSTVGSYRLLENAGAE
jgi:hypothetical protein